MTDLSVIILSYNTKEITKKCLESVMNALKGTKLSVELIVVDNASKDFSASMLQKLKKEAPRDIDFHLIQNKDNLGYTKGNNQGLGVATGKYILFLNSDTIIKNVNFQELLEYMDEHEKIGALTVKVVLPDGGVDPASHRGFPTVWNSFTYFSGLEKVFGHIPPLAKKFGGYHLTHLDRNKIHEIDSPTGAFYLTRQTIMRDISGFDDVNFFMYGEDLDMSYRIKKLGFKIIYYPFFQVLHLKHRSGIKGEGHEIKKKTREHFYDAMQMFYKKHYEKKYPRIVTKLVYFFINLKRKIG